MSTSLIVAEKQARIPGILDTDGTHIVNAVNHNIVKIGKLSFWHNNGVINRVDERTGEWMGLTSKTWRSILECFADIYREGLVRSEDPEFHGMKLEMLGISDKEEIRRWYDKGMELYRAAREHGAPEVKGGAKQHVARLPKWFRF